MSARGEQIAPSRDLEAAPVETGGKPAKTSPVALSRQGWRVMTVWECALKGPARLRASR